MSIWRKFNDFVIRLDEISETWEERVTLYIGFLIKKGNKSSTIKSYVSGIKSILLDDNYPWNDNLIKLTALTKACRKTNDRVKNRLPIRAKLLQLLLKEVHGIFSEQGQLFLLYLYQCMFLLAYFGLLRVGEMTCGEHLVKAKDVHCGRNKKKILIILFTSKTHGLYSRPQEIKIWSDINGCLDLEFSPFEITKIYGDMRGSYRSDDDTFFIFGDGSPVKPKHFRTVLRTALKNLGLEPKNYDTHSFRIGRATDLMRMGVSIDNIKHIGRWRSNAVFKYIR